MSIVTPATKEYFDVQGTSLLAVANGIDVAVHKNSDIIVEKIDSQVGAQLTKTPYTIESVFDTYEGQLNREAANEIADTYNRAYIAMAETDFASMQAHASIFAVAQDLENFKKNHPEGSELFLRYKSGSRMVALRGNLTLSATRLIGLEQFGEMVRFEISQRASLITHKLEIQTIGTELAAAEASVEPTFDEQLTSWAQFLESNTHQIITLCSGLFENEEELDEKLSELWMSYDGTSKEEEAGPILDQIRVRAMSVKNSQELRQLFHSDLPSAEQITETIQTLEQL